MSAATPLVQGNDDSTYQQPTYKQQYQSTYQDQESYQSQQTYQPQQQYQPQAVPYQPQQQYHQLQQPYQAQPYQPVHVQDMSYTNNKDEQNALLLLVFGFFCCLLWIVNFVTYTRSSNDKARKYARVSRMMFIAEMLFFIILLTIYFVIILTI